MFNIIRYTFLSFILVTGIYGCGASTQSNSQLEDNTSLRAAVHLTGQIETVNDSVRITLSWKSENIDFCMASGAWSGDKSLNGEEIILNPGQNRRYEISCTTGLDTPVTDVIDFTESFTVNPSLEFTVAQESVDYDGSTELSWSADNVDVCVASDGWTGAQALNGSMNLQNLVEDQVYTLTCSGDYGLISKFVTVVVADAVVLDAPELSFTASSSQVAENTSFTLSWSSSFATQCQASGAWLGPRDTSGSEVIPFININSHFVLQCEGPGGSITRAVDVVRIVQTNNTGTALLSWTAPTANTDETTLTDLAGYRIYYGTTSGSYTEMVTIDNPGVTEYLFENLSSGEWFFVMTAFNAQNIESSYSVEASTIIN